ncbi:Nitrate reductase [NADH] 1 [Dionaea muscipula]
MAMFVENRHYRLEPAGQTRRSDSPIRSLNFSAAAKDTSSLTLLQPSPHALSAPTDDLSSSDDDDGQSGADWKETIRKSSMRLEPSILDSRDQGTADHWVERNPSMIRLTGKHPFNSEPPLARLMEHGFITPVPLHYVRNHGPVLRATWDEWTVEVTGLVKRPRRLTMEQLVGEFPSREFPVTLVCAGNRRKEQNMVKQTIGFNWGAAGTSTSVWRGVPLVEVLKRCLIMSRRKGALNVCFEGAEELPGGGGSKYGTSVKKEVAMDPSSDIILAYMQNGERLSPDHGFPVRVIIPGYIGGRMVKWLKRIIVTTQESDSYYHYNDNRVLPSHVDAELAIKEAWWYKPEYIINELNINSVITTPSHGEELPISSSSTTQPPPFSIRGYAYSGGGRKVTRVEVTLDGGETWRVCQLDHPEKPNRYGKYWCWCFWSLDVEVLDLLRAKEIAVRAWDESLNTQPEKLIWNLMGMMNNCWFRVKTSMCKQRNGTIGIVFEHPTQPANQTGGWMAWDRPLEQPEVTKKSISTPNPMKKSSKVYSMSEVKRHNSPDAAWIIVHDHIYDCTRFLKDHPGGADSILINAGTDCTEEFDAIHSAKAQKLLEDYYIGELMPSSVISNSSSSSSSSEVEDSTVSSSLHTSSVHGANINAISDQPAPFSEIAMQLQPRQSNVALKSPREKIPWKLIEKVSMSHDVRRFRFALPEKDHILGLPVGKHVSVYATIDGKLCVRAYTPTSSFKTVGFVDLVVKIYFKGRNPNFPYGGVMSQYLDSLSTGSVIEVKGPLGHIEYAGRGDFLVHGEQIKHAKKLAMIAGGTGITPIYQVIQAILEDPEDETEMHLVYANRSEDDVLLRDELDGWAKAHGSRLKVWYVVSNRTRRRDLLQWKYCDGRVSEAILREHIPAAADGTLALACGPLGMIETCVKPNLVKLNYDIKEQLLVF